MQHEILRYLLLVLPFVFCTTLAALIIWGEDIRRLFPRLILYSLIASFFQTLTYQISDENIRFMLEVASGFLVAWLVFKNQLVWIFKVYATAYTLSFIYLGILIVPIVMPMFNVSLIEMQESVFYWIVLLLPANILLAAIVYGLKSTGIIFRTFKGYWGSSQERPYPVIIAVFIQLVILSGLSTQIIWDHELAADNMTVAAAMISITILFSISFYILITYFQRQNQIIALSTQAVVSDDIMDLINTVKGKRHDTLNHLQIISGLAQQNQIEELNEYLRELLQETSIYSEILKINNPIISALLNTKISKANLNGVDIKVDVQTAFTGFETKAMDIARILANLIDNAVDAVIENKADKIVEVKIAEHGHLLTCMIENASTKIIEAEEIFKPGITSKNAHSGLGLYNCKKLAEKLHGRLELVQENNHVKFVLMVPKSRPRI